MPLIVSEVGGELSYDQNEELVSRLTRDSAEVTGIPEEAFVVCSFWGQRLNCDVSRRVCRRCHNSTSDPEG